MSSLVFSNKKVNIRKLTKKDLQNSKKFCDYINSLIDEETLILLDKKLTEKEEKIFLENRIKNIGKGFIFLIAEKDDKIIGIAELKQEKGRRKHIANLGISVRKECREMGLGTRLTKMLISFAKMQMKPEVKFIRLGVFPNNKPALELYKSLGFKKIASIPKQLQHSKKLFDEVIMSLGI